MIIAFSGIDGSGKSTWVRQTAVWLAEKGQKARTLHLTQWTLVFKLGQWIGPSSNLPPEPTSKNFQPVFQKWLRQLVMLVDVLRFHLLAVWVVGIKKEWLVCDRYFFDLGITGMYLGIISERFFARYWRWVRKPAILFLLTVSPEAANQRENSEHTPDYYVQKHRLYTLFAPQVDAILLKTEQVEETAVFLKKYLSALFEQDESS